MSLQNISFGPICLFVILVAWAVSNTDATSNLKFVKMPKMWQANLNLHVILPIQTLLQEAECSNYCTIRDTQFRKVFFANFAA